MPPHRLVARALPGCVVFRMEDTLPPPALTDLDISPILLCFLPTFLLYLSHFLKNCHSVCRCRESSSRSRGSWFRLSISVPSMETLHRQSRISSPAHHAKVLHLHQLKKYVDSFTLCRSKSPGTEEYTNILRNHTPRMCFLFI